MTKEDFLESSILSNYKSIMSFAKEIKVPYTTVKGIMNRGVAGASVQTIIKVCDALGIKIEYLMEEKYNGRGVRFGNEKTPPVEDEDDIKVQLIENYDSMNVAGQHELLKHSRLLLNDNQYKKCDQFDLGKGIA